jgi:periplasmic protein TonB
MLKWKLSRLFPGGDSSWVQTIEKNLNQSIRLDKGAKNGKYFVSVQFVVDKDGYLSDIRCVNDPGFGMCREVLRIIKKSPKWVPVLHDQVVRPYRRSAITFQDLPH